MSNLSLQACRVAEEMHRLSPEAHYEYAQTLIATGEMKLANKSLSAAAELNPNNTQYHYQRGMNFYYLNQYDAAENSFLKALSIDLNDVDSSYQLAYIYAAQKKETFAKQQIEKVLQIQKEHPKIQSAKLLLEYVRENALDKLPLKIIPHDYHVGRSKSHYKSGNFGLALIEIETAAKLKPNNLQTKEILIGLSGFLLRINMTEKAVKQMISIAGETAIITAKGYQELGDIEVLKGNLPEARTYYEKVLKLSDPNGIARQTLDELPEQVTPNTTPLQQTEIFIHPSIALNRKGELFAQYKMYKRAIAIYSLASRIRPNHLPTMLNTATAYYNSENFGKSISILERLLLSHPNHENILVHRILLAQAYVKSNNRGKSLKNIAIAIKINPAVKTSIRANPAFEILRDMNEYKKLTQ
jgi:tetratricopeptide (TPR) repeat protein